MQKLVVYGKGGIGKSTIASNISYDNAVQGRRVLHVGCDPKHDSTIALSTDRKPQTIGELLLIHNNQISSAESFLVPGKLGIDLVESGGPEPGVGCGGRVIARMFDVFEDFDVFDKQYDLMLFDLLGDVVCGGFAVPMRQGFADQVVIVISEEVMSLYAANNICRALQRFSRNGVRLAGMVVNRRENAVSLDLVHAFVDRIGARILETIPRDPSIRKAEMAEQTVSEYAPDSEAAMIFHKLSDGLRAYEPSDHDIPKPMSDDEFRALVKQFQEL